MKTKKGTKGTVKHFISRRKVLRDLQISLPNFNRLCIWKNVYPVLPRSLKKAGRGNSTSKLYYSRNDIKLIEADPVFDTLRKVRAHRMKLNKAIARRDKTSVRQLLKTKPKYSLGEFVSERYGDWETALAYMDRSLSALFLLRGFSTMRSVSNKMIRTADKLCMQWLHILMRVRGVRGVFWTNGNYLVIQSEVLPGTRNIWNAPLGPIVIPKDFDVKLFTARAEFAISHVVNVLRKLCEHLQIAFPPQPVVGESYIAGATEEELLASLAFDLKTIGTTVGENEDNEARKEEIEKMVIDAGDDNVLAESIRKEYNVQNLFKGKKIFLSSDVNKQMFTFLIRACGGNEVSWSVLCEFARFPESDDTINYQITSKPPKKEKKSLFRSYVTPMWVVQSINAGRLLPVEDFVPGGPTIANICPFLESNYVTKESLYYEGKITADQIYEPWSDNEDNGDDEEIKEVIEDMDDDDENMDEYMSEEDETNVEDLQEVLAGKKTFEELEETNKSSINKKSKKAKKVTEKELEERMERVDQEMNIPKKQRRLYNKIVHSEKQKKNEVKKLQNKRKAFEMNKKSARKV